jgi:molecular chaperone HscB
MQMTDYFEVLGVPRRFSLDPADLERRFYQLSRENHPDRFTTEGMSAQKASLTRMSELNQAYRALKAPVSRREHLLELEGVGLTAAAKSSQIPMELAEGWFELQDALMEDPAGAAERFAAFEAEFLALNREREAALQDLERQADRAAAGQDLGAYRGFLAQIAEAVRQQSYLSSMGRDIERLKPKL